MNKEEYVMQVREAYEEITSLHETLEILKTKVGAMQMALYQHELSCLKSEKRSALEALDSVNEYKIDLAMQAYYFASKIANVKATIMDLGMDFDEIKNNL